MIAYPIELYMHFIIKYGIIWLERPGEFQKEFGWPETLVFPGITWNMRRDDRKVEFVWEIL
jgi:hypothetical protein